MDEILGFVRAFGLPDWSEGWRPSRIFRECGAKGLLRAASVRAVHGLAGRIADLLVTCESESGEFQFHWGDGVAHLGVMRQKLIQELRVMGGHHWGTYADIVSLCDCMGLGIMVVSDKDTGADEV